MNHNISSLDTNQSFSHLDIQMAKRFLTLISQCDEPIFAFQIFADKKKSEPSVIPRVLNGSFEQHEETLVQVTEH